MKTLVRIFMFTVAVVIFLLGVTIAFGQDKKDTPKDPDTPTLAVEKKSAIQEVQIAALQHGIQINAIRQAYTDRLNQALQNDPEYVRLTRQSQDESNKFMELLNAEAKTVNGKKFVVNPQTLDYIPEPKKEQTPTQTPPAESPK